MANLYWKRVIEIQIIDGSDWIKFRSEVGDVTPFEIRFSVPFSDTPTPSQSEITLYNLNEKSIGIIKKGNFVRITAGYRGSSFGVITEGTITEVRASLLEGVDRVTTFTILEGKDYSEHKEVNISFGNGTDANTILKRVSSTAGIPIAEIKLKNNKIYGSGYTADGQAMGVLEEVAEACETSVYYKRGQLMIKNFRDGNTERLRLSPETGLINQPSKVEADDYTGWSVQSLLQHKVSTGTAVTLDCKNVKGDFYVKSGTHTYDGSNFTTNCEVVL